MVLTQIALTASILLCSLVAGLVFTFAIVIMPGIRSLEDREFLRAFVVMDRVIQNNHPLFIFVWLGSTAAVIALAILSFWQMDGVDLLLTVAFSGIYLLGVQLPTIAINIPLNNRLQSLELDSMTDAELTRAREGFEPRWIIWNSIRTVVATMVTTGFIILALRL